MRLRIIEQNGRKNSKIKEDTTTTFEYFALLQTKLQGNKATAHALGLIDQGAVSSLPVHPTQLSPLGAMSSRQRIIHVHSLFSLKCDNQFRL
jgi:bisphosphoglycerate-independent phosphoglycerate mutase (AlkP superfamily)